MFYCRMIKIFNNGFSALRRLKRGSIWQIAPMYQLHRHTLSYLVYSFFSKQLLTTRWWQKHIRVFWICCDLGDPSAMPHKGTSTLKCFSHVYFVFCFLFRKNFYPRLFTLTSESKKKGDSAALTRSHHSTAGEFATIGTALTDAKCRTWRLHN